MQFRQAPQSMQRKIAILIIALVSDVSCIRNGGSAGSDSRGSDATPISVKLKNFFPSQQLTELNAVKEPAGRQSAVADNGFRPSQMLEFTPADATSIQGKRYPPSYVEPNYKKYQLPSGDTQFAFPRDEPEQLKPNPAASSYHSYVPHYQSSTPLPSTPVVSYLDPYTQQNYQYTATSTSTPLIYQREQPNDQVYTVQSSLLVGSSGPQQSSRPGIVEDVYLKRPGYVFDERPTSGLGGGRPASQSGGLSSPVYRRPSTTTASTLSAHKISYDSHDYPPPSYAAEQTSNFVPQQRPKQPTQQQQQQHQQLHRPPYNRQDVSDNWPLAETASIQQAAYAPFTSSNYANNFGNYLQRPPISSSSSINSHPPHSHSYPPPPLQSSAHSGQQQYHQYEPLLRPGKPHQQSPQPPSYQPPSSSYQQYQPGHNYYEYQIGEIPPPSQQQQQQQFNYRPEHAPAGYRPGYYTPSQSVGGGAGSLATLASLFTSTQQYAPQFTNLLLAGVGAGGGGAGVHGIGGSTNNGPLGSLLGAFTGATSAGSSQRPAAQRLPSTQLIRALENIARNDDLQCVPKVLCQMIAGQTLRGQLPAFITSPAITNFLAGFPAASPALIYGRAALLGLSGGERSCIQSYEKCPKNEMEIIHYLNNHRGGFFKFFSEPEDQPAPATQLHSDAGASGASSFFSILSALTGGGGGVGSGIASYATTPRPVVRPTTAPPAPSMDIADGIGNFFTRLLSEYLSGVEYQRRRRRRRSVYAAAEIKRNIEPENRAGDARLLSLGFQDDDEDDLDTQMGVKFQDDAEAEAALANSELIGVLQFPEDSAPDGEGRILRFKGIDSLEEAAPLDQDNAVVRFPEATGDDTKRQVINEFNRNAAKRKLKFPTEQTKAAEQRQRQRQREREAKQLVAFEEGWSAVLDDHDSSEKRRGKRIVFKDTNHEHWEESEALAENVPLAAASVAEAPNAVYEAAAPPQRGARVIFPDHYERYIRRGKILNRPTYAPSYDYAVQRWQQQQNDFNYGEYLPGSGKLVRFTDQNYGYNYDYPYPSGNYVSDDRRYSSGYQTTRQPKHEDDKNIYVNNAKGITEYYIRPDGGKVYLGRT